MFCKTMSYYHYFLFNQFQYRQMNLYKFLFTKKITTNKNPFFLKITFKMMSCDLLATLRARITHWCIGVQERKKPNDSSTELKPPFRLISHGHELTHDLDMKTLGEIGVRDQQVSAKFFSK